MCHRFAPPPHIGKRLFFSRQSTLPGGIFLSFGTSAHAPNLRTPDTAARLLRRRKLRIACGCGKPRRLLTPLLLLSVKSHAAVRLFACKRAHNGSLLLPTFYGKNALTTAHACYQLFTVSDYQAFAKTQCFIITLCFEVHHYRVLCYFHGKPNSRIIDNRIM